MANLYWSIYKNLEDQLLSISYQVHFTDKQLNVFSMNFVDIIMRAAVEIESLSKKLYENNGGNMSPTDKNGVPRKLYFDTDCIEFLNKKWFICQKKVSIIATTAYFEKSENITISPLNKSNKRGEGLWKKAYQNIKHNREEFLSSASLKNCIYALGALYVLNLYYIQDLQKTDFDNYVSKLFMPKSTTIDYSFASRGNYDASEFVDCVFLDVHDQSEYNTYLRYEREEYETLIGMMVETSEYSEYMKRNSLVDFNGLDLFGIFTKIGGIDFARRLFNQVPHRSMMMQIKDKTKRVLNKNQIIYTIEKQ